MEWHDAVSPLGEFAVSRAKNAPSIVIAEGFAAERLRLTGESSLRKNPHTKYSSKDYRSDCVLVSAMAEMSAWACDPSIWQLASLEGLTMEMVIGTLG